MSVIWPYINRHLRKEIQNVGKVEGLSSQDFLIYSLLTTLFNIRILMKQNLMKQNLMFMFTPQSINIILSPPCLGLIVGLQTRPPASS